MMTGVIFFNCLKALNLCQYLEDKEKMKEKMKFFENKLPLMSLREPFHLQLQEKLNTGD